MDNRFVARYKRKRFRLCSVMYTLADLERMTGAERFDIQLWAREGLLKAVEGTQAGGRGVPRQFELAEVELAALMGSLSGYCSLGFLRTFAKKYRARATGAKFKDSSARQLIDAARQGDSTVYLSFLPGDSDRGSIELFRWDQNNREPPERIRAATDALIINLARAWAGIQKGQRSE